MTYYYIARSEQIITRYSSLFNNQPLEFKKGYIIFKSNFNHFEHFQDYVDAIHNYELVRVYKHLAFTSKSQVYAKYLTLKIDEMTNNGASVFFPVSFNILKKGFSKLYLEKPELLV